MAAKTSLIPTSKAKTAYGLLSEIRALIVDEPKRYNQHDTLTIRGSRRSMRYEQFPACDTVGCVAGWTVALKARNPETVSNNATVLRTAAKILGLNNVTSGELFNGSAADGNGQTPTHARNGARHIRRFQKTYRAQLLAKKV